MCAVKEKKEAQSPLILRCHRMMEAFAKSDDERDFYIDRLEGFLIYVDLDKSEEELNLLYKELNDHPDRYCPIPKLSFYETKKIMEGFVHEKVYDIDTKEKLLDIIQSKEARENFLEFIYDHHTEVEKWQQFYQERSRVRIIEWLRLNHFHFVFEEDLELPRPIIEKLKQFLFDTKVNKDILAARKALVIKAKTYYSNEALNPRPKRGRPPKQAVKLEVEPLVSIDIFTTVPSLVRPFLFIPDLNQASHLNAFSSKFDSGESHSKKLDGIALSSDLSDMELSQKLASLRSISSRWLEVENAEQRPNPYAVNAVFKDIEEEEEEEEEEETVIFPPKTNKNAQPAKQPSPKEKEKNAPPSKKNALKKKPATKAAPPKKKTTSDKAPALKKILPSKSVKKKK